MRSTFAIAALAGIALAMPHYGNNKPQEEYDVVVETIVETVYVTDGYAAPEATPASEPVYGSPATTTSCETSEPTAPTYQAPSAPVYQPPTKPSYSAPAPSKAPSTGGYMDIVNKWRQKMGLSDLIYDAKLESNARKCVTESHGTMVHELNPGSMGQVLAPGGPNDFEHVFVGGWLCEKPSLPGLDGICQSQSSGWDHSDGETGHADILTSGSYSKIGCCTVDNIWGCDVA